jgi:hypothetical protein
MKVFIVCVRNGYSNQPWENVSAWKTEEAAIRVVELLQCGEYKPKYGYDCKVQGLEVLE